MRLTWRAVLAVLLTLTAVLFLQAAATLWLRRQGVHAELAANLPRLVGLPIVLVVAWWVIRLCGIDPRAMFTLPSATMRLLGTAALVGVLLRVSSWATIQTAGAFGWLHAAAQATPREFGVGWACPSATALIVSAITWIVLVPVTEELVQRGIVLGKLAVYGMVPAVAGSSLVFMLYHEPGSFATALLVGLLLGYQYWITRTLWVPIMTHAVYDGLQIADTLCLRLKWNPPPDAIPVWEAGVPALVVLAASLAGIGALILMQRTGVQKPRPALPGASTPG